MTVIIDGTNGVQSVGGSATITSFTAIGDTNTGIFFPAADTIAFAEGGVESVRITSAGDVGIGTSSPGTRLDVSQANAKSATGIWQIQSFDSTSQTTGVGGGISFGGYKTAQSAAEVFAGIDGYKENSTAGNAAGALRFHTQVSLGSGLVERMRLDASGNLIVGGTSAINSAAGRGNITINGSSNAILNFGVGGAEKSYIYYTGTDLEIYNTSNNAIKFGTNNGEKARITSGGELLVNATSQPGAYKLYTSGTDAFHAHTTQTGGGGTPINVTRAGTSGTANLVLFASGGSGVGSISTNGTTTSYNTSSDRRLKENIVPADDAGDVIDAIEVVKHDWKNGGHTRYGVIAQDLNAVAPEAVAAGDDGDEIEKTWGVDYSKLVPMLVKEIQSLRARVAQLEAK